MHHWVTNWPSYCENIFMTLHGAVVLNWKRLISSLKYLDFLHQARAPGVYDVGIVEIALLLSQYIRITQDSIVPPTLDTNFIVITRAQGEHKIRNQVQWKSLVKRRHLSTLEAKSLQPYKIGKKCFDSIKLQSYHSMKIVKILYFEVPWHLVLREYNIAIINGTYSHRSSS